MQKVVNTLVSFFSWNLRALASSLAPSEGPAGGANTAGKVILYSLQFFTKTLPLAFLLALSLPLALVAKAIGLLLGNNHETVFAAFEKNPDWNQPIDNEIEIGVTTSEYQVNGADNFPNSSWAQWEKSRHPSGAPCIEDEDRSGRSLDFWRKPQDLIDKLRLLNLKRYRFSVEWSAVEPEKGLIDQEALQRYKSLCEALKEAGIEPFVTLHHFSDPTWFLREGGFEKEHNIGLFTGFAETVHKALSPWVKEWVTFNEPAIYAFQGYFRGEYPPGVKDAYRTGSVLKHLLQAHCQTYDRLKPLDGAGKIGIAHNFLRFKPYSPYNPLEKLACHYLTMITHRSVMDFFRTGQFQFQIPLAANLFFQEHSIKDKFDFFGVQYYTDPLIRMEPSSKIMDSTCYPHEKMTDMPYRFFPQGLATALEECHALGKPIWITETGAAAKDDDQKEFIEKALRAASFAKSRGIDVTRVHVWTLQDNFEWNMGWKKRFGLFSFNPLTQEANLRPSGKLIQELTSLCT
ncbi:family 1 glycosylhydrolase [Estrella lausannensis]|uniref:Glycoside hydrolase n=1 Tax=Estrella lausannensis TaxID=483423 RepID=A0A0H5E5Z2_9BACT|nr:family 1 glycosylhydrolase [Estrella lausannensis]CRX38655.1 Glycoside hydrolase [Estrella lausannensis]